MSSPLRSAVVAALLLLSAACVTSSSPARHAAPPPPPPPGGEAADASYDWHALVLAPFGTLLKDSPVPLHEVLLFRDQETARGGGSSRGADGSRIAATGDAAGAAAAATAGSTAGATGTAAGAVSGADANAAAGADIHQDCYAIAGAPPRFVGHEPDRYLMCFESDRLNRIEASVPLRAAEAPRVFARACTLWLKGTAAAAGHTCEGRDGGVAFSARLALGAGDDGASLSITLGAADVPHAP